MVYPNQSVKLVDSVEVLDTESLTTDLICIAPFSAYSITAVQEGEVDTGSTVVFKKSSVNDSNLAVEETDSLTDLTENEAGTDCVAVVEVVENGASFVQFKLSNATGATQTYSLYFYGILK